MLVKVTKEDIRHGVGDDCEHCPIALAIGRMLRPQCHVRVHHTEVLVYQSDGFVMLPTRLQLGPEAAEFIRDFDANGAWWNPEPGVKLTTFEFELPGLETFCEPEVAQA